LIPLQTPIKLLEKVNGVCINVTGHYDGVIIDIFFDYFLAKNWAKFSAIPFDIYTDGINTFFNKIGL
jgi:hypothetical protein